MLMGNWAQAGGEGSWGQPLWGLGEAGPQTPGVTGGSGVTELPGCPGKLAGPRPRLPLWAAMPGATSVAHPCPGLTWGPHLVLSMSSASGYRTPTRGWGRGPAAHQEAFSSPLLVGAYGLRDEPGLGTREVLGSFLGPDLLPRALVSTLQMFAEASFKLSQEPGIPGGLIRPSGPSPVAAPACEQKAKKSESCGAGSGSFRTPALSLAARLETPTGRLRVSPLGVCGRQVVPSFVPVSRALSHARCWVPSPDPHCGPGESCCSSPHFTDELTEARGTEAWQSWKSEPFRKDGVLGSGGPWGGASCARGCRVLTNVQVRAWSGVCDSMALGGRLSKVQ
uniref:uncharacterized protein LOC118545699 n=1 Tax=Halichoerus grypus TaxID=9711 RepID=UPI0016592E96|nr:uncharacterized protein LOC118545699 [Halichoerus grypus]XP_035964013.1 uncharacterized protein LOC118545699 [Halichoerus grypus]